MCVFTLSLSMSYAFFHCLHMIAFSWIMRHMTKIDLCCGRSELREHTLILESGEYGRWTPGGFKLISKNRLPALSERLSPKRWRSGVHRRLLFNDNELVSVHKASGIILTMSITEVRVLSEDD